MGPQENVRYMLVFAVVFLGQVLFSVADDMDDAFDTYTDDQKTWIQANVALFVVLIIASVVILGFVFTCCCCCCACCRSGSRTVVVQGGAPVPQTTVVMSQQQQMGPAPAMNPQHIGYDQ